jgi:hypothetical protein
MATMSSARFRSLYRRHNRAHEAVYHFSANSVRDVVTGFSATRTTETCSLYALRDLTRYRIAVLDIVIRPLCPRSRNSQTVHLSVNGA